MLSLLIIVNKFAQIAILLSILNEFANFAILLSILNKFAEILLFLCLYSIDLHEFHGRCQRPLST